MSLIDVHTHIWLPGDFSGSWGTEYAAARRAIRGRAGLASAEADQADDEVVPADPETHRTGTAVADRCVVVAFRSRDGLNVPNDSVAAYVREDDRLVGFGAIDPRSADAAQEVRSFPALGLRGLKIAPIYQYVPADDDCWAAVFSVCEELSLPVLVHMGTTFLQFAPLEYAWPVPLERWLREFPRLRLCIAHLGHPWEAETVVLIRKHPNAFADLSALAFRPHRFANALLTAIEYSVTDKLMFGSDFPVQTTAEAFSNIERFIGVTSPYGTSVTAEDLRPALDGTVATRFLDGPSVEPLGRPMEATRNAQGASVRHPSPTDLRAG